ncbi:MAG: hypothetical protein HY696_09455 [Deltaproteobacteria bacterium]|nr:hypothetical protein [Deltaproteobacteria bacterium]
MITPSDVSAALAAGRASRGLPARLSGADGTGHIDVSGVAGSARGTSGLGTAGAATIDHTAPEATPSEVMAFSAFLLRVVDSNEHAAIRASATALDELGEGLWRRVHNDTALHARLFAGTATDADRGQLATWTREIVTAASDAALGASIIGFMATTYAKYVLTTFAGYVQFRTTSEKLHATETTLRAQVAAREAAEAARAAAEARADARPPLDPVAAALLGPAAQLLEAMTATTPILVGGVSRDAVIPDVLTMRAASESPAMAAVLQGLLDVAPVLRAFVEAATQAEGTPIPAPVPVAGIEAPSTAVVAAEAEVEAETGATADGETEAPAAVTVAAPEVAHEADDARQATEAAWWWTQQQERRRRTLEDEEATRRTDDDAAAETGDALEVGPDEIQAGRPQEPAAPPATVTNQAISPVTDAEREALLKRLNVPLAAVDQEVTRYLETYGPRGAEQAAIEAAIWAEWQKLKPGRSWRTASVAIQQALERQFPLGV